MRLVPCAKSLLYAHGQRSPEAGLDSEGLALSLSLPLLSLYHLISHSIGCERTLISTSESCPALGQRGNNATSQNSNSTGAGSVSSPTPATNSAAGSAAGVTESTISSTQLPTMSAISSDGHKLEKSEHLDAVQTADNKKVGVAFGFMVPICLVCAITLWLFYAYRNPHTRSGQLLIQVRMH